MKCGLLGRKLGHSYSPQIHNALGDYPYKLFEVEPEHLEMFLQSADFTGLNVTIPYKKAVLPYCATLSKTAQRLGAVNTLVRKKDGTLIGHNTDYFGFASMLQRSNLDVQNKKVLVLGSGGASNTAVAVLQELGANVIVISRSGENNYDNLHLHGDTSVIVNATPVGMYPHVGVSPIELNLFPKLEGVLDLIYNPARTKLLLDAEAKGLITENGLWMLVAQAKESAEWFIGSKISNNRIPVIHKGLRCQMENIILIGMPGCGKSTVGALLGEALGRPVVDADKAIEEAAGCTIPEIFARGTEVEFRQIETAVLSDLSKQSGLIIATGGGCVTREENYPLLHQNGTIVWIKRDLRKLATEGRPLSQVTKMEDMFKIRKPMYEQFADLTVSNDGTPEETASRVLALLEQGEAQ